MSTQINLDNTIQGNFASEQQWLISLVVANTDLGVFDKFAGGDVTSSPNKHRPGGMGDEVTYFALPSYSDVTISRVYETQRDHDLVTQLRKVVGRATAVVTMVPLDSNGAPFGANRVYTGRLIAVKDGGTDSNSTAPRMLELDISVTTVA